MRSINIFLDFNAVIVNLDSLPYEKQRACVAEIQENINTLKAYLEENIKEKECEPSIPATGMAVLRQQYILAEAIQTWIDRRSLRGAGLLGPLYRLPGGQAKQISLCMNRKRTRRDLVKENSSSHPYRHGNGWGSFLVPLQIM